MHAYIINLARSTERRAHIISEVAKSGIAHEIMEGIEGRDLDVDDPQVVAPSTLAAPWFRPGVAGCVLSHRRVYEKILADGLDQALVLEDDVTLPDDLDSLVWAIGSHLSGAEVALLNYDSQDTCKLSRTSLVSLPRSRLLALPIDVHQPKSGGAYVITREACKRMTEFCPPVRARADDWGLFYQQGLLDRVRCVFPMPATKSPTFQSTIDRNSPRSLKARTIRLVTRQNISVLEKAITYRRQRILDEWAQTVMADGPFIENPSRLE